MIISTIISGALLLASATKTTAAPQATGTLLPLPTVCTIPDYGPFKMLAIRTDTDETYAVRLQPNGDSTTSTMVVSTNQTCTNCGKVPPYWQLDGMVLSAANSAGSSIPTINQDVPSHSNLLFTTGKIPIQEYPIYCGVRGAANEAPQLAVHGTTKLFTMCAFTSIIPPATRFTIVYDRAKLQPVGESCYPVSLVMQSIGIVPT